MLRTNKMKSLLFVFLMVGGTVFAQGIKQKQSKKVTSQEVSKYAMAFTNVRKINRQAQQKMVSTIKENGLTVKEYQTMRRQNMNPKKDLKASNKKKKSFQKVNKKIKSMQPQMQEKMEKAVTDAGLSMKRYQQISKKLKSDKKLRKKVLQKLRKKSGGGMPSPQGRR